MIRHITEHEFEMYVMKSNKQLVIVDFWAPWCKPCQAMEPTLDAVSRRFTSTIDIIKVNVDDESRLVEMGKIRSVPTMIFFQNGNAVKRESGFKDEAYLTGVIAELLKQK